MQDIIQNIDSHRDDAKSLVRQLDELLKSSTDVDPSHEQGHLDVTLKRYRELLPAVEVTSTRSSIVVKCYEFRERVDKRSEWLKDTGQRIQSQPPPDDLQSVRVLLEEQEVGNIWFTLKLKLVIRFFF